MDVRRYFWVGFGALNQVLFGLTVLGLFVFLRGGDSPMLGGRWASDFHSRAWIGIDSALAIQFALLHSALLYPPVRSRLNRIMPAALAGSVFCAASCLSLMLTMFWWRSSPRALWHLEGEAATLMTALFLASWGALTYSLWLTGFGYQTGFTPWWAWVRHRSLARRSFAPRGAYRVMRHPIYLSFLGLVWFNPSMTLDRLVLALLWTAHVFVGSYLKDRRLERAIGEPYRDYATRVPGYPFVPGPLGRRPLVRPTPPAQSS